jgi:hypothetical protein
MSRWGVPLLRRWRRPRLWPRRRQHQAQQDPPERQRPLRRPLLRLQHRRLPGRDPVAAAVAVAVVARLGPLRRHLPPRALPVEMGAMRRGQAPAPALGPKPPPRNRHKRRLLRPVAQRPKPVETAKLRQTPKPVATARPQVAAKPVEPRASPTRAPPRRLRGRQPVPAVPRRQPAPPVARR